MNATGSSQDPPPAEIPEGPPSVGTQVLAEPEPDIAPPLPPDEGLPPPAPSRAPARRAPSTSQVVGGIVLVLLGLGWMLEATDVVELSATTITATLLVVVGGGLLVGARAGRHGGLIALGTVLTVVTAATSALDVPLSGGIGDHTARPLASEPLPDAYRLAIGSLTVDLREVSFAAPVELEASVGIGELIVIVPAGVSLSIDAHVGAGEIRAAERVRDGVARSEGARA